MVSSYPPDPPLIHIYSNCLLPEKSRKAMANGCLAAVLDSHPLFPERVSPVCDIVLEAIRLNQPPSTLGIKVSQFWLSPTEFWGRQHQIPLTSRW